MRSVGLMLLLAFSFILPGKGQVTGFEYFINSDPGVGHGTPLSISSGTSITGEFNIPLKSLEAGFHQLGLRVFDKEGRVSQTYLHPFYLLSANSSQISEVEYFIDKDPGQGKGAKIPYELDKAGYLNYTIPLSAIDEGHHLLGIRTRNAAGIWSQTHQWFFYNRMGNTQSRLVRMVYRFEGEGAPQESFEHEFKEPASQIDLETLIALTKLEPYKSYKIFAKVVDEHGAESNELSASFSINRQIVIANVTTTGISCEGEENGTASVAVSSGSDNLEYSLDNTTFQNGNRFENLAPGNYTVYVRDKSDHENVVQKAFTINPASNKAPATPTISIEGEDGKSQELLLVSSSATGNQWYKDGNEIPGATAQSIEASEAGTYHVIVTGVGGCSSSSEMITITALPEVNNLDLKLYPNPADTYTTISLGREVYVDKITVYSAMGIVLKEMEDQRKASEIRLDLSSMVPGIYFVQVQGTGFVERLNLIIR